jgi:hypothetical protein
MNGIYSISFCKKIVHEIITSKNLKYKCCNQSYFYDLADKFPEGTLLDDIIDCFHEKFPLSKISFKHSYIVKYNSKPYKNIHKTGILVEKLK